MFNIERWPEVSDTIRKNKLRTFLAGLFVASVIFILVILSGFGNGIANEFAQDAATSVWVWPGVTIKRCEGLNPGRNIQLRNENYEFSANLLHDDIEYKSPRIFATFLLITVMKPWYSLKIRPKSLLSRSNRAFSKWLKLRFGMPSKKRRDLSDLFNTKLRGNLVTFQQLTCHIAGFTGKS